jgi:hypothetical protein
VVTLLTGLQKGKSNTPVMVKSNVNNIEETSEKVNLLDAVILSEAKNLRFLGRFTLSE